MKPVQNFLVTQFIRWSSFFPSDSLQPRPHSI